MKSQLYPSILDNNFAEQDFKTPLPLRPRPSSVERSNALPSSSSKNARSNFFSVFDIFFTEKSTSGTGGEESPISKKQKNIMPRSKSAEKLLGVLSDSLSKLGFEAGNHDSVQRIMSLEKPMPDSAVASLRCRVLQDDELAEKASQTLLHYSAEALAKGTTCPEDRLLRLELLVVAATAETRGKLMSAVRTDLARRSDIVNRYLTRAGDDLVFIPQVTIGGGPQGQTIANHTHEHGVGGTNLIIDASASGCGNFGSIRQHLLNSETGNGYIFATKASRDQKNRSKNPVHGGPIQVEDLNPTPEYPTAGDIGDAASLGLYAASLKGTPVLVNTKVTSIEEVKDQKGRYLVSMEQMPGKKLRLLTDQIIDATGLGVPSVPLKDQASHHYIAEQTARCKSGGSLSDQAVMHSEDMLRATCKASDDDILDIVRKADGDITVVGWGDSAKTPLLRIKEVADKVGCTMAQLLGDRKILWIGPKNDQDIEKGLWGPYSGLTPYFEGGLVKTLPVRLEAIKPGEGAGQSNITVREQDGTLNELQTGRVILAMGMKSNSAAVLNKLVRDYRPEMRVPVYGDDPLFGEGPLCTKLRVDQTEHNIFFVGVSSGISRPEGTSYLEYFGSKTRQLLEQRLLPKLVERNENPFEEVIPINRHPLENVSTPPLLAGNNYV